MASSFLKQKFTLLPLADSHLSIVRYPVSEVPSSHDEYSINYFPSGIVPEEEFDPAHLYISYGSGHSTYNLRRLRGEKRVTPAANRWFSHFLRYLQDQHFAVPDAPNAPATFRSPKKTCKSSISAPSPDLPVSNSFEVLASARKCKWSPKLTASARRAIWSTLKSPCRLIS